MKSLPPQPISEYDVGHCDFLRGHLKLLLHTGASNERPRQRPRGESFGNPVGVECEARRRPALVPLDRLGNVDGNMRTLGDWPSSVSVAARTALWLFARRAEANAGAIAPVEPPRADVVPNRLW
jgi:hypothetical protein